MSFYRTNNALFNTNTIVAIDCDKNKCSMVLIDGSSKISYKNLNTKSYTETLKMYNDILKHNTINNDIDK